jgi:hypothetical protein
MLPCLIELASGRLFPPLNTGAIKDTKSLGTWFDEGIIVEATTG